MNYERFGDFVSEVTVDDHVEVRTRRPRRQLKLGTRFWFALVVILPTALAIVYYGLIASDLYMSEAHFVVRSKDRPHPASGLEQAIGGGSSSAGAQDTFTVRDYILSRDALRLLDANDHIRAILHRPGADFLSRFPGPFGGGSFESLYRAYQRFVTLTVDETSGLATLEVKAYAPQDAKAMALALLGYSEQLVNRMSRRAEQDTMAVARTEVERAEQHVTDAELKLTQFRNQSLVLDPTKASTEMLTLVSRMWGEVAARKARLMNLQAAQPNSPQIATLRGEVQALEAQIKAETAKMVGSDSSMAPKLASYEELQLQSSFAQKELASAFQSLETARVDAARQHLYLERVVEPEAADYALYPRRLISIVTVFGVSLLTFALGWLLVAGAREHVS